MPKGIKGFIKGNTTRNTGRTRFKKGDKSWNVGLHIPIAEATKKKISAKLKGIPKSEETIERMKSNTGDKKNSWKGDNVGYSGLHKWVTKLLGQPSYCAYCQSTDKKYYHWANISHAYKRDLSDWVRLCVKCHSRYDHGIINLNG